MAWNVVPYELLEDINCNVSAAHWDVVKSACVDVVCHGTMYTRAGARCP